MDHPDVEEPILPRLMASNALRANLTKHMTLNQMADQKASMIMTAASLMLTISATGCAQRASGNARHARRSAALNWRARRSNDGRRRIPSRTST